MWYKVKDNLIEKRKKEREGNRLWDLFFISFIVIFACLIFMRAYIFSSVIVSGTSMNNTLESGDVLVVNRLIKPKNGDIIVFYATTTDEDGNLEYLLDEYGQKTFYIKRVIACGGEKVFWENGVVSREYFDGEKYVKTELDEPYALGKTYDPLSFDDNAQGTLVPENHYFVLGDNRYVSNDSRGSIGMVDKNLVLGVVPQYVVNKKDTFLSFFYKIF